MTATTTTYLTFITVDGNYTIDINNDYHLNLILRDNKGEKLGAFSDINEAIQYAYGVAFIRTSA